MSVHKDLEKIKNEKEGLIKQNYSAFFPKEFPDFLNTLSCSLLADYAQCLNVDILKDPDLK
jgi:hypothetical protein